MSLRDVAPKENRVKETDSFENKNSNKIFRTIKVFPVTNHWTQSRAKDYSGLDTGGETRTNFYT